MRLVPRSLRAYLAALVAAAALPMLAAAAYVLFSAAERERAEAEASLGRSASALRVALDREIQIAVSALETLRHSRELASGDLAAFTAQARLVKDQHPSWIGVVLTGPDGQQLMNLAAQPGQKLPNIGHYEVIQAVVRTHAPAVSELMVGRVRPVPLVGIDVPVIEHGKLKYVLGLSMPAAHIQKLLEEVPVRPGATATILDYKDIVVAGSGARAGDKAGILPLLGVESEGIVRSAGGDRVLAFSRAHASRWVAAVSMPAQAISLTADRIIALLLAAAAVFAASVAFILFLGRRMVRPIEELAARAPGVVRGESGASAPGGIAEVDALEAALRDAGERQRLADEARERALETAQQAQKMEAVGRLTGGIAHDFNNLLAVIANSLAILDRDVEPGLRRQTLDAVRRAADRGAALTRQLLVFSRESELLPANVDTAAALRAMRAFLASSLRADIAIELELAPELWPVHVDAAQLDLAILNLALNARDAMPRGGAIRIVARNEIGPRGESVRIEFSDDGEGMPPETVARAFEPFFTTKPAGAGSGLGLAQVYGFAVQSGGEALIRSAPRQGTTVSLVLPRGRAAGAEEKQEARPTQAGGGARVLLVEDDDHVAWTTEMLLRQLGHGVTRMRDAAGAIDALARGDRFDVVLSDIVMPGEANGIDLARDVRAGYPHLPVILVTAYSGAAGEAEQAAFRVLRKPYEAAKLSQAIDEAVAKARSLQKTVRAGGLSTP
ncbi:MAG TPA: ATP-binding protein [Burkholderiales bacterium]|nr:ATP-binding protein [Burkholderiales bacterium]